MHRRRVTSLAFAACMAAGLIASNSAIAQSESPDSGTATSDKLLPLDIIINDTKNGQWVLLQHNGVLYAPEEAFVEWRLNWQASASILEYRGQKWIPLNAVPGYKSDFSYADQSLTLTFSPKAFEATRLAEHRYVRPALTPTTPAIFLNYDLNYNDSSYNYATSDRELSALTELGLSAGGGVLTSSAIGHNLTGTSQQQPRSWTRLETTYTRDFPNDDITLKVGDSTTRRGSWGQPIYFGGVQIGHNFALSPGFISQPIPVLSGTSSAPSTVELYVNDVLRQTSNVPTGPFTIDNFPLITNSGDARIVVKDALGRETVIDQPFFTSPSLLEQGLSDWSAEIGAVRNNFGISNADYGQHFASGLIRHGISKTLTVEGQGEWGQTTKDGGIGVDYALPFQALGQMAYSISHDQAAGSGTDWMLGIEKSGLQQTYSLRYEKATQNYRQVGLGSYSYKSQLAGNYSHTVGKTGSLSFGLARINTYTTGTLTTYSGNYSTRVYQGSLVFTGSKAIGNTPGYSLGVSFLLPLDNQVNVSSNVTRVSGQTNAYVSASKGLTQSTGSGWRALAGTRDGQDYGEGGYYYQSDHGLLTSDASISPTQHTLRLGAQGGMVFMDGHGFLSRRVDNSFALVEVPGYPNVGIGFQGSTLTHTGSDGTALLTHLLPYQRNSIRLDPNELPINAELDSIEQVVVPASRSGVKVVFPVRSGRGALIHVLMTNGDNAPAGATVRIQGDHEDFYVGRHGQVYVTGLNDHDTLKLFGFDGKSCIFTIDLPPEDPNNITRVGPVNCLPDTGNKLDTEANTP
jgi:outer membrane usher protein